MGVAVALSFGTSGCQRHSQHPTLKLAYVNWADGTALTYLAEAILEEKLGYEVELTMADVAPVFTSVADGGHDAFLDAWLPVTHADYMQKFGDRLNDLGPNYVGTQLGLVVPDYVEIRSIAELNRYRQRLEGEIVGIDSGAGLMQATERAIEAYQLRYRLLPSSEAAMTAALKEAVDDGEPIVVTGWKPHWMFARWDLRFLKDPQAVYGTTENIHTVVRPGFPDDHPEATRFFTNYRLTTEQLEDLMNRLRDPRRRPPEVARQWMQNHPKLVIRWLEGIGG